MAEVDLTLSIPVPKSPPSGQPLGGLSWNPQAQLVAYEVRGPFQLQQTDPLAETFLSLNPARLMWVAYLVPIPQHTPQFFPGIPERTLAAGSPLPLGLPARCHAAEWPGLCQGEWTVCWPSVTGYTLEWYEVCAIH